MGQNINWWDSKRLGHRPIWGLYLHTTTHQSQTVTQSQLTTQGQSFAANLALSETMIEPVLNDDHAKVK
jgi:hypothetical protein